MADLMQERNRELTELAEARRYRTERREDGELVIRLPGKHGAHAGRWGVDLSYLLIPCSQPARRATILKAGWPGLIDRSGDFELLVLGSHAAIESILASGPSWARARRRNSPNVSQASLANLSAFAPRGRMGDSGRSFDEQPQTRATLRPSQVWPPDGHSASLRERAPAEPQDEGFS